MLLELLQVACGTAGFHESLNTKASVGGYILMKDVCIN